MIDSRVLSRAVAADSAGTARTQAEMRGLLQRYRKPLGFLTFGALAGGTYAVVLVIAVDHLGMPMFLGSVLAFALAIPVSFLGNRWVTYRSRNMAGPELLRFIVVQVANLVITSAIVGFVTNRLALGTYVAVLVAFAAAPIVSFVLFEIWVYRQRHAPAESRRSR